LTDTDGDKIRWYGNQDNDTSTHTYFTDNRPPFLHDQFEAVVAKLKELTTTKDGNGDSVVEFVAMRRCERVHFVAYRFTSDWAYRRYSREVQELGLSLGRGGFEPWHPSRDDYAHYLA
jgi:hypothetical protein